MILPHKHTKIGLNIYIEPAAAAVLAVLASISSSSSGYARFGLRGAALGGSVNASEGLACNDGCGDRARKFGDRL